MSVQQQKFKEIADAIREKTGTTELIKPSEFASKIEDVYTAGQNAGGGGGYDEGFADGKQAEYDRFWDVYQENGNRTAYGYCFSGAGWVDDVYNPKYPINLVAVASTGNAFNASKITDTLVPITASCQTLITLFANATSLVTIPRLDISGVTKLIDRCFSSCGSLTNLTMVGSINANGFDVSPCKKLSYDSLILILKALADKTSDTSGTQWACTLGADNLNKLSTSEIAAAVAKGWELIG